LPILAYPRSDTGAQAEVDEEHLFRIAARSTRNQLPENCREWPSPIPPAPNAACSSDANADFTMAQCEAKNMGSRFTFRSILSISLVNVVRNRPTRFALSAVGGTDPGEFRHVVDATPISLISKIRFSAPTVSAYCVPESIYTAVVQYMSDRASLAGPRETEGHLPRVACGLKRRSVSGSDPCRPLGDASPAFLRSTRPGRLEGAV
jgi:hypothetical protein